MTQDGQLSMMQKMMLKRAGISKEKIEELQKNMDIVGLRKALDETLSQFEEITNEMNRQYEKIESLENEIKEIRLILKR